MQPVRAHWQKPFAAPFVQSRGLLGDKGGDLSHLGCLGGGGRMPEARLWEGRVGAAWAARKSHVVQLHVFEKVLVVFENWQNKA